MADKKRKALGRGLSALLGDAQEDYAQSSAGPAVSAPAAQAAGGEDAGPAAAPPPGGAMRMMPIEKMMPGSLQPRTVFDEEALKALAVSIKANGVLTPLIVRTDPNTETGVGYEIVSGERRWRAAQMAQLHEVPVIVRDDIKHRKLYEVALVDNIQREDLNDVEEAAAYGRLISEFGYTQKTVAQAVGKSRAHVTNTLRLLKLPPSVIRMVERSEITAGHARALLAMPPDKPSHIEIAARAVSEHKLSVRDTEEVVKRAAADASGVLGFRRARRARGAKPAGKAAKAGASDANAAAIESRLRTSLGLDVSLKLSGGGRGAVTIAFENLDQFDSLLETLGRGLARRKK